MPIVDIEIVLKPNEIVQSEIVERPMDLYLSSRFTRGFCTHSSQHSPGDRIGVRAGNPSGRTRAAR